MSDQITAIIEPAVEGYTFRAVTLDDLPLFRDFVEQQHREHYGTSNVTVDDLRAEWTSPGFDLRTNTHAAFTQDGVIAAYIELWDTSSVPVRPRVWGYTHPAHRGGGLATALLDWGTVRACHVFNRVPAEARVVLETWAIRHAEDARQLLFDQGFTTERGHFTMRIELDEVPPAPTFPPGYRIVTYPEHPVLHDFVYAHKESFRDHRGYVDTPIEKRMEQWEHHIETWQHLDQSLWFLVLKDDEIAAIMIGNPSDDVDAELGWIDIVGVLRPHRRRGLALALLQHAFAEYYRRGIKKVGLGVDAASLTNATALYEQAGMHVHHIMDAYEKELRPGVELTRQE
jgi:mycothiol synthase